jgi:hypothetical protein
MKICKKKIKKSSNKFKIGHIYRTEEDEFMLCSHVYEDEHFFLIDIEKGTAFQEGSDSIPERLGYTDVTDRIYLNFIPGVGDLPA